MIKKITLADIVVNEIIIYGGLPMSRKDVYRDALNRTGSTKAADMFAFGPNTKIAPSNHEPYTLEEFNQIVSH